MASNVPMKLLLLAALVAMTAASPVDKTRPLAKKLSKVPISASQVETGGRKLLAVKLQTVPHPDTRVMVSEGTKASVSSTGLNARISDNDRKLMTRVSVVSADKALKVAPYKAVPSSASQGRKLMAVDAKVNQAAATKIPIASGSDARVVRP